MIEENSCNIAILIKNVQKSFLLQIRIKGRTQLKHDDYQQNNSLISCHTITYQQLIRYCTAIYSTL